MNAQAGWARPFGDFNVRWLGALFRPIRPIKDFLNGKWLGHSVHAVLTDVPIGALTLVIVFDLLDLRHGGRHHRSCFRHPGDARPPPSPVLADYTDTDDDARMVATVHATFMVIALVVYLDLARPAPGATRPAIGRSPSRFRSSPI